MEGWVNILKNTKTSDRDSADKKKLRAFQIAGACTVCVIIIAAFLYIYIKYGKQLYTLFGDAEHLRIFLSRFNGYDKLVFVAIRAFQTVIKIIPAEPLEIGSGVLYGTWGGLLLCILGTEIGSLVIIALTKLFGRRLVNLFIPIEKVDSLKFLQNKKKVYLTLFFIYLIPGTPKDILTYAAGITNLNLFKFLIITGIARIPSIITSTLCGEQLIEKNYDLAVAIFVGTAILAAICSAVYKKYFSSPSSEKKHGDRKDSGA